MTILRSRLTYCLDLAGCWAKLDRGKRYVDQLRDEVREAGQPDSNIIPLRREYHDESRSIVVRIEHVPIVRDHWALIVGDAVHNFRCALDHLGWQLAIRCLGRDPTEREARNVQFPIVTNPLDWRPGEYRHLRFMSKNDAALIEEFQPYKASQPLEVTALGVLASLSNIDKHRTVHVAYVVIGELLYQNAGTWFDCDPDPTRLVEINGSVIPRRDEEVLRLPVIPRGPNPDRDLKAQLSGHVAIHENWPMVEFLDHVGQLVAVILRRFEPRL